LQFNTFFNAFLDVWTAAMKMQTSIFVLNALSVHAIRIIKYSSLFMGFLIANVEIMRID